MLVKVADFPAAEAVRRQVRTLALQDLLRREHSILIPLQHVLPMRIRHHRQLQLFEIAPAQVIARFREMLGAYVCIQSVWKSLSYRVHVSSRARGSL